MRRHAKALATAAALVVFLAFAATASAAYVELGSFAGDGPGPGGEGAGNGQLDNPGQADVYGATGNLYVADTANNRVEVFKPTATGGEYDSQAAIAAPTGLAIDQATGDVYVANASGISKFDSSLAPITVGWSAPATAGPLAVDPSTGDLLVADTGANLIRRFDSDGTPGATFAADRPVDLAANSSGEIFVVTSTGDITAECGPTSSVVRFSSAGVAGATVGTSLDVPGAVAVDPDDDAIAIAANVNEYWCEAGPYFPEVAFFAADGTATQAFQLGGSAEFAMVPGLAAQGGDSTRVYAVTKSPGPERQYGHTKIVALADSTPPEATIDPVAPGSDATTEAVFSGSVDANGKATGWHFEYRIGSSGPWTSTPTESAGSGTDPVPTGEVTVTGLQPHASYEARLLAANVDGQVIAGPIGFATTAAPPTVQTLAASELSSSGARLRASVNPNGEVTTYRFEYGSTTAYGTTIPVGGLSAGQGSAPVIVSAALRGLPAATTFHYRVLATNGTGTSTGLDQTFTTAAVAAACPNAPVRAQQGSEYLADCRAFEQVTPVRKFGYNGTTDTLGVSADGSRVSYRTEYPLPGAEAGSYGGFVSERGSGAWSTAGLLPVPDAGQIGYGIPGNDAWLRGSTPDQSVSAYWDTTTAPWGSLGIRRADGSRQRIASSSNLAFCAANASGGCPGQAWYAGISDDGTHVVFASSNALVDGLTPTGNDILYEWVDDGSNNGAGTIRVVNRTNDSTLTLISGGSAELGGSPTSVEERSAWVLASANAISADGSRIFFQDPAPVENNDAGGPLYVREDGVDTRELSAPDPGHSPAAEVKYLDAAVNGSRVFFWADGQLTDGADAEGGIYAYDLEADQLEFLATAPETEKYAGEPFTPPTAIASADGSTVYYEDGPGVSVSRGGQIHTVDADAKIGAGNFVVNSTIERPRGTNFQPGIRDTACATANVTASGRYFAFIAETPGLERGFPRIYRYDADAAGGAGTVEQVSISPTAPAGSYGVNVGCDNNQQTRPTHTQFMSEDGQYVFFNTEGALVSSDSNLWIDAYQWHAGVVSLLASGAAINGSLFKGADASGENAFFLTDQALIPQDGDATSDLYNARIGGGFLQSPAASCAGEGCQGAPTLGTPAPTAGSAGFTGAANPKPKRHKQQQKKKQQKKKKNAKQKKHKKQKQQRANHDRRASR